MNTVYLAGGQASGWQDRLIAELTNSFVFFNPHSHQLKKVNEYTAWDLHYVRQCDILFGYMEATNPSGYGLALEVGFAKALGKTIILVDERSKQDDEFSKRYNFIHQCSDVTYDKLSDGITMLRSFNRGF